MNDGDRILISVVLGLAGLGFIYWGLVTVKRKRLKIFIAEGEIETNKLSRKTAVAVGWFLVFFGIAIELVVLLLVTLR